MIQDTAWSPRFVPSTTATAATSGEAIAGTDTTKFITPSLLPAATSYHAGPVVNARAPRQGLVFDGTSGATHSNITLGSGDFTVAVWARVSTTSAANRQLIGSSGGDTALFLDTTGLAKIYISGQSTHTASSVVPDQKSVLIVYTRSGTSGTFYQNSVANGTVTDSNNYSTAWSYFGARSGGGYTTGTLIPLIYNRALSAAEVVALYEAGAPSGADYNSASNTAINTSNFVEAIAYTTFTGVSATGFSATQTGAVTSLVVTKPNITINAGNRVLVTFTGTLTSGAVPNVGLVTSANGVASNISAVAAGSNSVVLTATAPCVGVGFYTTGAATSYSISNVVATRLGLLLAPDAAQAGGGLVWYDTSGNAANITLPASGVSWNVPFAGYVTSPTTTNLTLAGGSSGASLVLGQGASGNATLVSPGTFLLYNTANTTGLANFITFGANNRARIGGIIEDSTTGAEAIRLYSGNTANGAVERARVSSGGNLLIGTTTDGGQKLQVNGAGLINQSSSTASYPLAIRNGMTRAGSGQYVGLSISSSDASQTELGLVLFGDPTAGNRYWRLGAFDNSGGGFINGQISASLLTLSGNLTASGTGTHTFGTTNTTTIAATGITGTNTAGSYDMSMSRSTTSGGANVQYRTAGTINWYHGLRGLANNNWYLFNNATSTNTLIFDYSTNAATFAGNVTLNGTDKSILLNGATTAFSRAVDVRTAGDTEGRLLLRGGGSLLFGDGAGTFDSAIARSSASVLTVTGGLTLTGALRLSNAYVAGVGAATGYVTIQDSTGTTYKVPVLV